MSGLSSMESLGLMVIGSLSGVESRCLDYQISSVWGCSFQIKAGYGLLHTPEAKKPVCHVSRYFPGEFLTVGNREARRIQYLLNEKILIEQRILRANRG